MRKYIISDIHGNGNFYYSIMYYLDNISIKEDLTLYINGDLIDRGIESGEILLDIIKRIKTNNPRFKIIYLGGNHEDMMYKYYQDKLKGKINNFNLWYENGGYKTDYSLEDLLNDKEILEVIDFIGNLDLYYKFNEKINHKNIILAHASCPINPKDKCDIKIKDNQDEINYLLWSRKNDPYIPYNVIGNKKYFTIIGHTPNNNPFGFIYDKEENFLNIDGGSSMYVSGLFDYDHYPLIEIKDNYLKILTFNNNNEIIYGNYFKNNKIIPYTKEELDNERNYLDKNFHPKKLVELEDGIIGYQDWKK